MTDAITVPLLDRSVDLADLELRKESSGPVRLRFSGSSNYRVERSFGAEILDHSKSAIRLDRARSGALPLLFNHNMDDPVGMVDTVNIDGERTIVDAHLFDTARAREVETMIRGGLKNVSTRYRVHKVEERKDGSALVREWEPYEYSIVTVPADPTVGVGRSTSAELFEVRIDRESTDPPDAGPAGIPQAETEARTSRAFSFVATPAQPAKLETHMSEVENAAAGTSAEAAAASVRSGPNAIEMEQSRQRAIQNLAKVNKIEARQVDYWINSGVSLEGVSDDLLRILEERGKSNPQSPAALGLSKREADSFSLTRAIQACAENNWKNAPFELECSRAVASKLNKSNDAQRFFVPFEVLQRQLPTQQRDLATNIPSAGGYLVATENQGFIEILRNRSVAFSMGARRLSGLNGNVSIPKQSGAATGYWLGTEGTDLPESQQTFSQIALTPKTVGAYTEISRNLLLQSAPGAEGIVSDDLAQVVALAADLAVLNGSGAAGQPLGIMGTTGIGTVTGTSLGYAGVIEYQTDIATSNVKPTLGGYVTTPAVAGLLMARARFSNTDTPLWDGNVWDAQMAGFRAMSSNQMPAGSMLFGDWSEVVVGEWGVLEVEVNPYANFKAGVIGVRAMYALDVGVRRAFAFSASTSGVT